MTVTTLNAAGPTYENIANTANAYADYINARGGIAGRPLEVTVCDEQFDPAVARRAPGRRSRRAWCPLSARSRSSPNRSCP